jgi:hypothetical protein
MHKLLGLALAAALAAPAADSGLLSLAMPDARVVAGINVTGVRNSPFGQFLLARTSEREDEQFRRFVASTGFDPRRDLNEVVFASPGGRGETRKLILARGLFDPARLMALAAQCGAKVISYSGVDIAGSNEMFLAFLDGSTAVAGDIDSVRGAIDRRQGGRGVSPDIATRIQNVSAAQEMWFVSTIPAEELAAQLPQNAAGGALKGDALKTVESASGGVKFGNTVNVNTEIVARTPQDAAALADVVRFLAGLALMQRRHGAGQFQPVLNSLDVKALGNLVTIALVIPEELMESGIGVSGSFRH